MTALAERTDDRAETPDGPIIEWKEAAGGAGWMQQWIDGSPMPQGYVQPTSKRWTFRPGAGGNGIWEHMGRLADLAAKAAVIVEVGVACCTGSTHAFDVGLRSRKSGGVLHIGVDLFDALDQDWEPKYRWFRYVQGDSTSPETVAKVEELLRVPATDGYPDELRQVDILYIDTLHTYDQLKAELAVWLPLIGPKTLCLFHDTHMGGSYNPMTNAILEMVEEGGPLAETHRYVQIAENCNGLGALKPI